MRFDSPLVLALVIFAVVSGCAQPVARNLTPSGATTAQTQANAPLAARTSTIEGHLSVTGAAVDGKVNTPGLPGDVRCVAIQVPDGRKIVAMNITPKWAPNDPGTAATMEFWLEKRNAGPIDNVVAASNETKQFIIRTPPTDPLYIFVDPDQTAAATVDMQQDITVRLVVTLDGPGAVFIGENHCW
jgi:hypothetical protein